MEIELKLSLDRKDREKLVRHPLIDRYSLAKPREDDLVAKYFDTPDFYLRRHDMGLRLRKMNGQWFQTMKAGGSVQGGLHQRHEWESPVDGTMPDIGILLDQVGQDSCWAKILRRPSLASRLQPLFTVRVKRITWNLHMDDSDVELVLDEGDIARGDSKTPVSEIELELKSGKVESLYAIALRLLEDVPLRLNNSSKAERGYALCDQSQPGPVKASTLASLRGATVGQGLRAILENCLAQIHGNEAGVAGADDSESLHQMRVGLRRLRSALGLFEAEVRIPADLQNDIEWLGKQLGAARDWDVLSASTLAMLADAPAGSAQQAAVRNMVQHLVREKREEAAQAVLSARYARFLIAMHAWMHGSLSGAASDPASARRLDMPLAEFARIMVERGRKRIIKRGRRIRDADPHALHRLRIACKKNRYAVEFFQSLMRPKRARRYIRSLAELQDELGWRNDVSVADGLLQQVKSAHPEENAALGFARGYLMAQLTADTHGLRSAWKRFRAAKTPCKP